MNKFSALVDPNGLFLGSGWTSKTVLGSAHLVLQLCFSKLCLIVAKKTFPGGRMVGWTGGRIK